MPRSGRVGRLDGPTVAFVSHHRRERANLPGGERGGLWPASDRLQPSMIVPFAGIALFAYWALTTGMTLVPPNDIGWVALIPHTLTLIIELQA